MIYGVDGIARGISAGIGLFMITIMFSSIGTVLGMCAILCARQTPKVALGFGIAACSIGVGIFVLLGLPFNDLGLNLVTVMMLLPVTLGAFGVFKSNAHKAKAGRSGQ